MSDGRSWAAEQEDRWDAEELRKGKRFYLYILSKILVRY